MNSHVCEELVHAINDWYKHARHIESGNKVIIVEEGHPRNNVGGSVVAIDTQMGTVTVMNIINKGGNFRIVIERSMTITIGAVNIICSICKNI